MIRRLAPLVLLALALGGAHSATSSPPLTVKVVGNRLVDGRGQTIRLRGVNRSGLEYMCVSGADPADFADGPTDAASVAAMLTWKINVVRLPLNASCWLELASYRSLVTRYVNRLHAAGLYVILDLHWNKKAMTPMADKAHALAFWSSVAKTFRSDRAMVFDVYNEPFDISWRCWRDGCGANTGMQALVSRVRAAGAKQPIMVGGIRWSNDLTEWRRWMPKDSAHQLVASFHLYNFNACITAACWDGEIAPVAAVVPLVTGELGEDDCAHSFVDAYMTWADTHGISYLGWTWNPWPCGKGPALITSWDGTPTNFGVGLRDHLRG